MNNAADELARRGALLAPSAISCSHSPLISHIHSSLFSDWRRTVSSKFFDTQVSSISTKELVLPHHAHCVLSRLRCNGHSLLSTTSCPASGTPWSSAMRLYLGSGRVIKTTTYYEPRTSRSRTEQIYFTK